MLCCQPLPRVKPIDTRMRSGMPYPARVNRGRRCLTAASSHSCLASLVPNIWSSLFHPLRAEHVGVRIENPCLAACRQIDGVILEMLDGVDQLRLGELRGVDHGADFPAVGIDRPSVFVCHPTSSFSWLIFSATHRIASSIGIKPRSSMGIPSLMYRRIR